MMFLLQENACRHATDEKRNLFGSAQCLGFRLEHGSMSPELCLPSEKTIVNQVKKLVKKTKAKSVVIATDDKPMTKEIQKAVGKKVLLRKSLKSIRILSL